MQDLKIIDLDKKKELFSKVELFDDFNRFEVANIAETFKIITYCDAGEKLIVQGTKGDCFYILLSGTVKITEGDDGDALFVLEAGGIFGEIAFLSGTARTRHVVANEKVFVLKVTQEMLKELDSEIREKIKDQLIKKLVNRILQIEEFMKK
jgi:CRP-like cAMP-binding protein